MATIRLGHWHRAVTGEESLSLEVELASRVALFDQILQAKPAAKDGSPSIAPIDPSATAEERAALMAHIANDELPILLPFAEKRG